MIDSHCHLADAVFAAELDEVISRAEAAGVHGALVILAAGDDSEAAQAGRVAGRWAGARFSIGVHPHAAHEFADDPDRAADLVRSQYARTPAARAIGEIGLDYHYDFSPRDVQQQVFRRQLRLAREIGHPVVIHTREADDDTVAILTQEKVDEVGGVLHCFTGTPALAQAGLDLGLFVSTGGIVTFPKAEALRETIKAVPLERLLVETDSPFLAPIPHRGKRNEPAYLVRTVERVAALFGVTSDELARVTEENYTRLFKP